MYLVARPCKVQLSYRDLPGPFAFSCHCRTIFVPKSCDSTRALAVPASAITLIWIALHRILKERTETRRDMESQRFSFEIGMSGIYL